MDAPRQDTEQQGQGRMAGCPLYDFWGCLPDCRKCWYEVAP